MSPRRLDSRRRSKHRDRRGSQTIGVGDAENDQAFLRMCGLAVAVDNALPAVKDMADIVTSGARGAGVTELIARLFAGEFDTLVRNR